MGESHALCGNGMGEVFTDAEKSRDGWFFFLIVVGVFNETEHAKTLRREGPALNVSKASATSLTRQSVCVCVFPYLLLAIGMVCQCDRHRMPRRPAQYAKAIGTIHEGDWHNTPR